MNVWIGPMDLVITQKEWANFAWPLSGALVQRAQFSLKKWWFNLIENYLIPPHFHLKLKPISQFV